MIFNQDEIFHQVEGECELNNNLTGLPAFPANQVRYRPDSEGGNLLDVFDGESLAGDWTLRVIDNVAQDTGVFNRWCVLPELELADKIFTHGFE
jgi:hypothetical protein